MTQELFGSSNQQQTARRNNYTGLNVFKVLGFNPTKEQIEEWTGQPWKLNVDYTIQTINGVKLRPIEVWVTSLDGYIKAESLRFLIGLDDAVNQNGTCRYVNSIGDFCQSKVDPATNPKMAWFTAHPYRVAKQGEYELFSFMKALMMYDSRGQNANFLKDSENLGITAEKLFDGELDGLKRFFQWTTENDNKITLLAAVRINEKVAEDGSVREYERQTVVNNPEYFFKASSSEVDKYAAKKIYSNIEKGRRITNSLFTVDFQEYVREQCLNNIPKNVLNNEDENQPVQKFDDWLKQ